MVDAEEELLVPKGTTKRDEQVTVQGISITIEYRKGDYKQSETDDYGWPLYADYGFINNTTSPEEEELDVYLGDNLDSQLVFMAPLYREQTGTGTYDSWELPASTVFDEYKVLLGFDSLKAAQQLMRDQYGWGRTGDIIQMGIADLQGWIKIQGIKAAKEKLLRDQQEEKTSNPAPVEPGPTIVIQG